MNRESINHFAELLFRDVAHDDEPRPHRVGRVREHGAAKVHDG